MKKQWEKRVEVFQYVYSCLICEYTKQEIKENALVNFNFNKECLELVEYIAENIKSICDEIKPLLEWDFDRVSYVDKAILITAIAECRFLKIDKKIVIDQALITAKNYNIEDKPKYYRYINPILDKVLK